MVKNQNIRVVKEDAVLGNGCDKCVFLMDWR